MSEKNLRGFRGQKCSNGKRTIRRQRYNIQSGDRLLIASQPRISKGIQHKGETVTLLKKPGWKNSAPAKNAKVIYHVCGWEEVSAPVPKR